MPAGSKVDPPLAKAKSVSDGGSTSVITYLSRGKKTAGSGSQGRRVKLCERNNSADTQEREEGGGGGTPGAGAEIVPLKPLMKTMVRQAVPLKSMEVHSGTDIHLQPMEGTPCRSNWMPEGSWGPVGTPRWSRLLPGPVDPWREEPKLEQVYWQGL